MFTNRYKSQKGFSIFEILIFIVVIVLVGAIGYWKLSPSRAELVEDEESSELVEDEYVSSTTKSLSSLSYANKTKNIEQFNLLTISNLDKEGISVSATKNTNLQTPPPGSDYANNKDAVIRADAPYLYYFPRYIDPLVSEYKSLKNLSLNTAKVGILENNKRINYVNNKEQYIKYAVDMANLVITRNLVDVDGNGMKEWRWNPKTYINQQGQKVDTGTKTCHGRSIKGKTIANALCTLRTTRALSTLAATIKSDSSLRGLYGKEANNYVKFIKNNILNNPYYRFEYNPNSTASHNKALFLNSQAADTLLNMYIASGETKAAKSAYLVNAKSIANKLKNFTLNVTMDNHPAPNKSLYLGINKLCDDLSSDLRYYNLFSGYASKLASDGKGQYSCIAADTSHVNQYVQMVANFRKNGFVFDNDYINKMINTLNKVMWQEWIDDRVAESRLKKSITINYQTPNKITNYLYNPTYAWPKSGQLKGKQIIMTCPVGSTNSKLINVVNNNSNSITLSGMSKFKLTSNTTCYLELYDKVYKDADGVLRGSVINNQFSDYTNGANLTFNNSVDTLPNPKYRPGKQGQNFAEWNEIISLASPSNPNTASAKAKALKAYNSNKMSDAAKAYFLTQSINW